jgi:hypothetical protein
MGLIVTEEILQAISANRSMKDASFARIFFDTKQGKQAIPTMLNVPFENNYITPLGIEMFQAIRPGSLDQIDKNAQTVRLGIYGGIFTFTVISDGIFFGNGEDGVKTNALLLISKAVLSGSEKDVMREIYPHEDSPKCSLCTSSVSKGATIVRLSCHSTHLFHGPCFISWCWKNNCCPSCLTQFGNFRFRAADALDFGKAGDYDQEQCQLDYSKKGC